MSQENGNVRQKCWKKKRLQSTSRRKGACNVTGLACSWTGSITALTQSSHQHYTIGFYFHLFDVVPKIGSNKLKRNNSERQKKSRMSKRLNITLCKGDSCFTKSSEKQTKNTVCSKVRKRNFLRCFFFNYCIISVPQRMAKKYPPPKKKKSLSIKCFECFQEEMRRHCSQCVCTVQQPVQVQCPLSKAITLCCWLKDFEKVFHLIK